VALLVLGLAVVFFAYSLAAFLLPICGDGSTSWRCRQPLGWLCIGGGATVMGPLALLRSVITVLRTKASAGDRVG
jgi:hypothetical protein